MTSIQSSNHRIDEASSSPWYEIDNAAEVISPALLIYPAGVDANLRRMIKNVRDVKKLRPHVKTHKLPQVIRLKRELGIDKFKAATIAEAEMTAAAGGRDILIAYPMLGPNIPRLLELVEAFPETNFSTVVDNLYHLEQLARAADGLEGPLDIFIDLDVGMHRTGLPEGEGRRAIFMEVESKPSLRARGFHAYDGHLKNLDFALLEKQVQQTFAPIFELRRALEADIGRELTIVAGGTPTSAILAREKNVDVGMGTPVLWDYGQSLVCPEQDYEWSAVLLTRIVSRPGPNRLCVDIGYKAVASEMPQPRVYFLDLPDAKLIAHSEEHLVIETERASEYPPGSHLFAVPYHICPTVALHSHVWVVADQRAIDRWPIEARNRQLYI